MTFQHSPDNSTFTDITSPVTAVGGYVFDSALPQTIYRYTRVKWTLSGAGASAVFFYGFARK
jgi:hypothetical protein